MNTKIIAIAAVAVLVVAGVGVGIVLTMEKNNYKYDVSKGWNSWEPKVTTNASTSKIGNHPLFADQVELMYKDIYGEAPDYTKYKMSDVPADYLKPVSYIVSQTDDTITIKSQFRAVATGSLSQEVNVTLDKNPKYLMAAGSQVSLLYALLVEKYDGDKAAAETKLWETVYAMDQSAFKGKSADVEKAMGLTVPSSVKKLTSTYSLNKNLTEYTGYVEDATATGDVVIMTGVAGDNYAALSETGKFLDMLSHATPNQASYIGMFAPSVESVFGNVMTIGTLFGLADEAAKYIDNCRLKFYTMYKEAEGKNYTAYMESAKASAAGTGTIINGVMTSILHLKNICDHEQWKEVGNEFVIDKRPQVIIFYENDTRTMDEKMRVGVEQSTTTA